MVTNQSGLSNALIKNICIYKIIFLQAGQGFSIKILLFCLMEINLPTPVHHPPSWGCSCVAYPPPKICLQVYKKFMFASMKEITQKNLTDLTAV
jgi:hypothetical protein